ncbi:Ribosome-binding protein 1, putative [Babesia ovata]|uniref:Ribosome-binding protein 1, putative n=1 Tax=Babesia ovata TaxID=189622 RepID=A0A2H6K7W3_9APIC|nr:Ribosome-binding protein 1, putative [Babesia ovata]GBE59087.1 Ribosome-binding protein 1, putative [Babesia ovata]
MAANKIKLNTLKDCLEFLFWLHNKKQSSIKTKVATQLSNRLSGRYLNPNQQQIQQALSEFLRNVSKFHKNLCNRLTHGSYKAKNEQQIIDALLECIPKFLAAMYFLRYHVDKNFKALGGGEWKDYMVGSTSRYLARNIDKYLISQSGSEYGVIPGGFIYNELKASYRGGYRPASQMAGYLTAICEKHSNKPNIQNYFLDVFSTSVLGQHGTDLPNTANALALVRTFCEIVVNKQYNDKGGKLISKLNEDFKDKQNRICWTNLKAHCAELQEQCRKIFADHRFSFTGFGRKVEDLKKEEFSKETAKWLRDNLATTISKKISSHMALHFTNITSETRRLSKNVLQENWANVIENLRQSSEGLEKLKTILDGQKCPEEDDKKSEGAQNQGKKAEGTPNQGKKADGTPNQNNGRSGDTSSGSASGKSVAPPPPSGDQGGQGPKGPTGDQGKQGSTGPGGPVSTQPTGSPVRNAVQVQQPPPQPPPGPLPPSSPPGTAAAPGSAGNPGAKGQGSTSGHPPGQLSVTSSVTVHPQPPGVSGKDAGPPGGGQDGSQGSDHSSSSGPTPSAGTAPGVGGSGEGGCSNPITLGRGFGKSKYCPRNVIEWKASAINEYIKEQEDKDERLRQKAYDDAQRRWQEYHQNLQYLNGSAQSVVESQVDDPRWLTDVDFAVQMSDALDGVAIRDVSPRKHEHERNLGLSRYDQEIDLQHRRQQQWESYYKDQNDKIRQSENQHLQEVQHIRDAINHFKEVEYRKQREAAEAVTGVPLTFKTPTNLPELPTHSMKPTFPMATGALIRNSNLKTSVTPTAMFLPVPQPTIGLKTEIPERPPQTEKEEIDLQIDVPKRRLPDNNLDFDLDFDDDTTYIKNAIPNDPIVPSTTAADLNFEFVEYRPHLPPTDFDRSKIKQPKVEMCMPDWSTQTPTHDLADIPETELFPSEAPHTVRDMLIWLAGLRNEKHHDTPQKCINNAFKRGDDDASDLTLPVNDSSITADNLLQTIKLVAVFAASVLTAVAPEWRMAVPSATSTRSEPDCCALLCQLRDYVYACYHQLAFLKSQCSRDSKQGGWQDCDYGSDIKMPSPLQAFLTDAHDSKFETHPFDPCDICRKSLVNMGFREEDLHKEIRDGKHIFTIISPNLEKVCKSLGQYIMDLDKWIVKTTKDVEAAQKLVQNILDEVNDNSETKNLEKLKNAIKIVEEQLDGRAADLRQWKLAADKLLQHTIEKGSEVHKNMDPTPKDPPEGTKKIGEGIKKIEDAKDAVVKVNAGLIDVKSNLQNWNLAAKGVLGKVVSKAGEVREKLDPAESAEPIGKKLKSIEDAKDNIVIANQTLGTQVKALYSWITGAERIRAAAEKKATEAYKLKVNETLDLNVQKIVAANKKIASVHTELGKVHGNLGAWNQEATKVLEGAIAQATDVYNELDMETNGKSQTLKGKIEGIETNNREIQTANNELGQDVKSLEQWKSAAQGVITKADEKCNKILEKVSQKQPEGKIYLQAEMLQEKGKTLLDAANKAKTEVGVKVKEALQAVVAMDKGLKMDLKKVKTQIQSGIKEVINSSGLNDLGENVKSDLGTLRKNILGLETQVNDSKDNGTGLVGKQLKDLEDSKNTFNKNGVEPIKNASDGLQGNFDTHIQDPLNEKVQQVGTAIEALGGNFDGLSGENAKKLETIFEHIRDKVEKINGSEGTPKSGKPWEIEGATGLTGIEKGVEHYFTFFQSTFTKAVGGWIDDILGHNGLVKRLLGWERRLAEELKKELNDSGLGGFIKEPLNSKIEKAQAVIKNVNAAGMKEKIGKVKQACELFAQQLEEKLEKEPERDGVLHLAKKAKEAMVEEGKKSTSTKGNLQRVLEKSNCECNCGYNCKKGSTDRCQKCEQPKCNLTQAIATTVVAVSSVARQVGKEVDSVLLGNGTATINIADLLDKAKKTTDDLHEQLTQATSQSSGPPGRNESPAGAVDGKLKEVREFVTDKNLKEKFDQVKQDLQNAVTELPGAVQKFDSEAQKQIKAAARTAIDRAANVISNESDGSVKLGKDGVMPKFYETNEKIQSSLQPSLQALLEKHIGEDDGTGGAVAQPDKVTISKVNFGNYNDHVDQANLISKKGRLTGEKGANEGQLPLAIGNIKTKGLADLCSLDVSCILNTRH